MSSGHVGFASSEKQCPRCQLVQPIGAKTCAKCAHVFRTNFVTLPPATAAPSVPAKESTAGVVAAAIFAGVLLFGVGAWMYTDSERKTHPPQPAWQVAPAVDGMGVAVVIPQYLKKYANDPRDVQIISATPLMPSESGRQGVWEQNVTWRGRNKMGALSVDQDKFEVSNSRVLRIDGLAAL